MKKNPTLTKEQQAVLFDKATEAPFSGTFLYNKDDGVYVCANCGAALFRSDTKYDSHCGWPSFDQAIPGAVKESTDTSHGMVRTEITCATCGGHLGHVFDDGPIETTGQRYCINSLSLDFTPKGTD
ncbi:MAG TPA: peptide-methionine (R)-S-oxide reductase MsrB [Dongiaceae bacterium]|nr:peptide-methionine (R)-S-oxide reductase MsrB [Dongiaceae bacterium]